MNQKEKLMELLHSFDQEPLFCDICNRPDEDCDKCILDQRADYLIKNGVIVPPVKVGDTVYCIDYNFVDRGVVYAVSQNKETLWFSARYESGLRYDYPAYSIGDGVLFTKEEAERALAERSDNDGND